MKDFRTTDDGGVEVSGWGCLLWVFPWIVGYLMIAWALIYFVGWAIDTFAKGLSA